MQEGVKWGIGEWTVDGTTFPEVEVEEEPLPGCWPEGDPIAEPFADRLGALVETFGDLVWYMTDREDKSDSRCFRALEVTPRVRWWTEAAQGRGGMVEATVQGMDGSLGRFRLLIDHGARLAFLVYTAP